MIYLIPWQLFILIDAKIGLLDNSVGKESTCNVGDLGSIPGLGRSPGEGNDYPFQYPCLENSMDRSLSGYSPWDCKESDTAESLSRFHLELGPIEMLK